MAINTWVESASQPSLYHVICCNLSRDMLTNDRAIFSHLSRDHFNLSRDKSELSRDNLRNNRNLSRDKLTNYSAIIFSFYRTIILTYRTINLNYCAITLEKKKKIAMSLTGHRTIPRQRKVIILSSVSFASFCTILKASVNVTRC